MESSSVPVLSGEVLSGPPDLRVTELACDGNTVFAAGFAPGSKVPVVWAGDLDPERREIVWSGKVGEIAGAGAQYLTLDADPGSRGSRVAISGHDEFSICTGVFVFERQGGKWAEAGRLVQPDGESDILFGTPLALRATTLFTLELPGGDVPGSVIHQFRRQPGSWSRVSVPFAPAVDGLWWQMSVSPAADSLAVTTHHRDGHHHVDLYAPAAGGAVALAGSVALPSIPSAMVQARDRIVVGLSPPSPEGASLVFLDRAGSGWRAGATLALPPKERPGVGEMACAGSLVVVSQGDSLWLVDSAKTSVSRRMVAPADSASPEGWAALSGCAGSVVALRGTQIVWFDLSRDPE